MEKAALNVLTVPVDALFEGLFMMAHIVGQLPGHPRRGPRLRWELKKRMPYLISLDPDAAAPVDDVPMSGNTDSSATAPEPRDEPSGSSDDNDNEGDGQDEEADPSFDSLVEESKQHADEAVDALGTLGTRTVGSGTASASNAPPPATRLSGRRDGCRVGRSTRRAN